jgi:hypothetical protein
MRPERMGETVAQLDGFVNTGNLKNLDIQTKPTLPSSNTCTPETELGVALLKLKHTQIRTHGSSFGRCPSPIHTFTL